MTNDTQALIDVADNALHVTRQANEELKRVLDALQSRIDQTKQYIQDIKDQKDIRS